MNQTLQALQPLTDGLASGIADVFTSLVDGSKSVEEAFADMLIGIGQALIQQAALMIAQYIAIGIARRFAGLPAMESGGSVDIGTVQPSVINQLGTPGNIKYNANGGYVAANQPTIVGERGPELLVPNSSGMIRSNETMGSYMPGNSTTTSMANAPINMSYNGPTLTFNAEEYIPRSEAPKLVAEGAKMGEMRTMASLKNNRSSRNRIGL